jgi:YcxB-like protein
VLKRWWLYPVKLICFVGLLALLGVSIYGKAIIPSMTFATFLVLLALGPRINIWLMLRRLRRSPFYNSDVLMTVTPDGYISQSEGSRSELTWRAFTKIRRLRDGFLVFMGVDNCYWWPDSAISTGSVPEVESTLRAAVADYSA